MTKSAERPFADRLEELAAGIVTRVGIDPPDLRTKLLPPQLRVVKGPRGANSYCVRKSGTTKIILIGADLHPFLLQYTRAAATFFLPSRPKEDRPSPLWPRACSALATTLDWMSSPAKIPLYPAFDCTARQEQSAKALAAYAYRFALCHEMAHVAQGHLDAGPLEHRSVSGEDLEVLRLSQQYETDADQLGLQLQFSSLPDSTQDVIGLSGAIYFIHVAELLNARLMLLNGLVDEYSWKIAHTHPPEIDRLARLMGAAERLRCGFSAGLEEVHNSLAEVDMKVWDAANTQQEQVFSTMRGLIDSEVSNRVILSPETTDELRAPPIRDPELVQTMLQHFNQSPLGVLRALERPHNDSAESHPHTEEELLRSRIVEQLALALPAEFQRFRELTKVQRALELA